MSEPATRWHDTAVELARWAVKTAAAGDRDPARSTTKAHAADWVTSIDQAVERHVRQELVGRFPDHQVIGEEYGATPRPGPGAPAVTWYLDPIDGTTNYVHGLPWVSFSLAGADERGPVVGVVADVHRGEVFSAVRGGGSFHNGQPISRLAYPSLAGGVVLTEWSREQPWPSMYRCLTRLTERSAAIRIMGSCALALATVAAGRAAGAILPGHYNAWDVMAGVLIAREAGAAVYDHNGPTPDTPMAGLLVAAPVLAEELWQLWVGE